MSQEEQPKAVDETPTQEIRKYGYPTVIVDLPSKGLLYPSTSPLSKGVVEMRYMAAKHEDILTTESYIRKGVVLDKLFESLLVGDTSKHYDDMLVGDREALMIATRIHAYGEMYVTKIMAPSGQEVQVEIDLSKIECKKIDQSKIIEGNNRFTFKLPVSQDEISFSLITNRERKLIEEEGKKSKRIDQVSTEYTSRLARMIKQVNDITDRTKIEMYVKDMLAKDARALRNFIQEVQPGMDMTGDFLDPQTMEPFQSDIVLGLDFFWPDSGR